MRSRRRVALRLFAAALVVTITAALVVLTLAQRSARADLYWLELSRYLPYYWLALPAAAGLGLSLWLGRGWVVVGLAAPLVLAGATMAPVWSHRESGATGATGAAGAATATSAETAHKLRLMTYNAKAATAAQRANGILAIGAEVARHDPDILVMQDADGLLVDRGSPAVTGRASVFGLQHVYALGQYVVLSRVPLRDCAVGNIDYRDEAHRYLRCTFDVHGVELTVVTAHFKSPRSGLNATRRQGVEGADEWEQNFDDRLAQSRSLARDLAALRGPLIVAGDLNASEASPVVQNLLATGLRDAFSAAGRGYGYTYGHSMRAGLSFLRIDHILVSPDIAVADCFPGGGDASEHRPVIADLSIPATKGGAIP